MSRSLSPSGQPAGLPGGQADRPWLAVLCVLAVAVLARAIAYTGFFGSDEVTYTGAAFKLLDGDWSVPAYVGANRFGINLPVAGFAWLLSRGESAAAAYSLLCSVAEVGLLTWFGVRMLGMRAGVMAGLVLALVPTHVHFAGRLIADAPLALAITASFLVFWDGEVNRRRLSLFVAGLAAGWSFWVKPHTIFYLAVLLSYPLVFRVFRLQWLWMVAGFAVAISLNAAFFGVLTGNPLFVLDNVAQRHASGHLGEAVAAGRRDVDPLYYFQYLFGKVHHTWLLGPLAVLGAAAWLVRRQSPDGAPRAAMPFVFWWALGLLFIFSFLVVSLNPLTFVPKQTNYMLAFLAPLALLAGHALAQLRGRWLVAAWVLVAVPSVMLALLLQADIRSFTANSQATVQFSREHPGAVIHAGTNAFRAARFFSLTHPGTPVPDVRPMRDWRESPPTAERFAVIDLHTASWAGREPYRRLQDAPPCWVSEGTLSPQVRGAGPAMVGGLAALAQAVPGPPGVQLAARLRQLITPAPAHVYRIPLDC